MPRRGGGDGGGDNGPSGSDGSSDQLDENVDGLDCVEFPEDAGSDGGEGDESSGGVRGSALDALAAAASARVEIGPSLPLAPVEAPASSATTASEEPGASSSGLAAGPAREPKAKGPDCVLRNDSGEIADYSKDARFQCTCFNPDHGQCILSRNRTLRSHMMGRPVCMMWNWLGLVALAGSKEEHHSWVRTVAEDVVALEDTRAELVKSVSGAAMLALELTDT